MPGRCYKKITRSDLRRLSSIAEADRTDFFRRKPETGHLYSRGLFAVALCQGAASHYVGGKNGINDFDVWSFYRAHPKRQFSPRRNATADFGNSKFGTTEGSEQFVGRRVDLIGRSLKARSYGNPIKVLQEYLRGGRTESARRLSEKAMVLIHPPALLGKVVWRSEGT